MSTIDRFTFSGLIVLMSVLGYLMSGNDWRVGVGVLVGGGFFFLFGAYGEDR
jgi:hypothetical protein